MPFVVLYAYSVPTLESPTAIRRTYGQTHKIRIDPD
jgi:hypothetical protein